MKILISGGTGLVGKELGKALVDKGHTLYVLTRNAETSHETTPYPHIPVYWDATKNSPPSDIVSQVDGVVHLAGAGISDKRWTENYKNTLFNSRVIGTQNLVRAINDHGDSVRFFISTSATGFYPQSLQDSLDEDTLPSSSFLGKLCVAWESPVTNFLRSDIRKVILRVGVVLSDLGGALNKMSEPIQRGVGGTFGSGDQLISWIDLEDLVAMYIFAIEGSVDGVCNAVAPQAVSNAMLTALIAKKLEKSAKLKIPLLAAKVAIGEMAQVLYESQNISSHKIENAGFEFQTKDPRSSVEKYVIPLGRSEKRQFFEQWIPKTAKEIFPFFSEPENLEQITPPSFKFKIIQSTTPKVEQDTVLEYKIKISGVPFTWITKITDWSPPHKFIDNQEYGPYKKWTHTHRFLKLSGGTLITDEVRSIVPVGLLGMVTLGPKVYGDVQKIFAFRRKKIAEIFGGSTLSGDQ